MGASFHPCGVTTVVISQHFDVVLLDERHLPGCSCQGHIPVAQRLGKSLRTVGQHLADVVPMLVDGLPAAQLLIEHQGRLLVEARQAGQRNGVIYLLFSCFHKRHLSQFSPFNVHPEGPVVVLAPPQPAVDQAHQLNLPPEAELLVAGAVDVLMEYILDALLLQAQP